MQVDLRSFGLFRYFEVIIQKYCLFRIHLAVEKSLSVSKRRLNVATDFKKLDSRWSSLDKVFLSTEIKFRLPHKIQSVVFKLDSTI